MMSRQSLVKDRIRKLNEDSNNKRASRPSLQLNDHTDRAA